LLLTSLLQVADYYITSIALQRVEQHRLACVSSLASFLLAFIAAYLIWWFLPPVDHTLSAGVIIATILFVLVTPSLTHPLSRSHGILVGYSTSGLPLYQSHDKAQSSLVETARSAIIKIMENSDSRRIFYFLILNLVRGH
jgi:zinc transporter 5/7